MFAPPTAEEIRTWREKHDLTQGEMAELLGLKSGATTISAWENGRATPAGYLRPALDALDHKLSEQAEESITLDIA